MGTYTTELKLYKPDPKEFVDVEVQLNHNWDIVDKELKRLLEYEYTLAKTPNIVGANRAKYYKAYSNSVQAYFRNGNFFWQGPSTTVNPFVSAKSWLAAEWFERPESPLFVRSSQRSSSATKFEIEWVGSVWMNEAIIPANSVRIVIPDGGIPVNYRPARSQYFTLYGGNTSTNYSIYRLFIGDTGRMEICRYGTNDSTANSERRLELVGVKYDRLVTG